MNQTVNDVENVDPVQDGAADEKVELTMVDGEAAGQNESAASVKKARFAPLEPAIQPAGGNTMDLLLDVQLELSVELGRANLAVKEVLQMGPGSVVELNKLGGEPVDILVNGRAIAKGEVVVVDENFGVRVTEIINKGTAGLSLQM